MAITITQQPNTPNGSQSDIIYVVSSTNTIQAQFKYVCDVQDSSGNVLARFKQPANPYGYGVFEISPVLDDYMGYDEVWKSTSIVNSSNNNVRDFRIAFGEEWGATSYGTTEIYNGQGDVVGNPAVSGSNTPLTIIPAVEERSSGFNFDYTPYLTDFLSNSPTKLYAKPSEWGTISHFNIPSSNPTALTIIVYNATGGVMAATGISNGYSTSVEQNKIIHMPMGPRNLSQIPILSLLSGTTWSYYTIEATTGLGTKTIYRLDDCSGQNGTRFGFINRMGVWDYYTATLTKTENRQFKQNTYQQNFIDYSTPTGTISFDSAKRGETVYNKIIDATYSAQTDWLTQEEADWLVELFESPSVYIQDGDNILPVIITNNQVGLKTNPKGQKLFTYTIEYRLANKKKTRR